MCIRDSDEDTITTADWVVDIGPGAGEHGGNVVHSGSVADLLTHPDSITGAYLPVAARYPCPLSDVLRMGARSRCLALVSTTCMTWMSASRSAISLRSPGSRALASRHWSTTSST